MSVCLDTSYDFSRRVLLVCIVIFRKSYVARRIYDRLTRELQLNYIHVREMTKKKKLALFSKLREILRDFADDVKVRIIGLRIKKGTNKYSKYAFVERLITKIANIDEYRITHIVVPTDLNSKGYSLARAIENRLTDNIDVIEDDSDYCVQLADAIINLYRREKQMPIEVTYAEHKC